MQRLWTFGDSFTAGCGCLDNEVFTIKYKKSDEDKIWPEIVASKLNFQLKNMGAGLFSNDKILDSIIHKAHSSSISSSNKKCINKLKVNYKYYNKRKYNVDVDVAITKPNVYIK